MATATATHPPAAHGPWPALDSAVEEGTRRARRAFADARHKAEDAAVEARLTVRRHPIAAVGAGVVTGALVGAVCGLAVAWFVWARE